MRYAALETMRARAKDLAYATPVVAEAVRRVRARELERAYGRLLATYQTPADAAVPQGLLEARGGERLRRFRSLDRRPRVLYVGTTWAQDSGGLLRGLESVAEVVPFTKADGSYGQALDDSRLSFDEAAPHAERVVALAEAAAGEGSPFDVVVGQMWSGYIRPDLLQPLRERLGALVVNIAMDDRHTFSASKLRTPLGTRDLAPAIDLAATSTPEAVGWYAAEGCAAIFWPEASEPDHFRPRPELGKQHDVCFVGERYGIRRRLVERLVAAGVDVQAYGSGWPNGRIDTDAMAEVFARSRLVLGVGTIGSSEQLLALKLRDFDGPMSGSCYVTHDNADLRTLYRVGEEIEVFGGDEECVRVVTALLADGDRRERIAAAGRRRAVAAHTWSSRFEYLLDVLRGQADPASPPFVLGGEP